MATITTSDHVQAVLGWQVHQVLGPEVASSHATLRIPIFVPPFRVELGEIALINSTIFSGADTNTVHLNFIDGGAEGAGTTQIVTAPTVLDFTSGVDLAVGKTMAFDNIIAASATLFMSAGDSLEAEYEEVGTGNAAAFPPIIFYIVYRASNLAS